jgi:hypothetical protein
MDMSYYRERINEIAFLQGQHKEKMIDSLVDEYATDFNLDYETAFKKLQKFDVEAFS